MQPFFYRISRFFGMMKWIRWGLRYKIFTYLKPINLEFSAPFYGCVYKGNLNNFIGRVVYFFGAHERQVMEYMGSKIDGESIVLDIGANVGHHSLFFSAKAKEVHSFEPNPEFHHQFDALMKENNITNVHLHKFGLGASTQTAEYYAPTGDNRGVGSFIENHESSNEKVGEMQIIHGDEAVSALQLSRIDFIKIDVEGYEESVLRGLQKTIQKFKPIIILEYEASDFSSEKSFYDLIAGYTPFLLKANTAVLFLFNNPACNATPFDFTKAYGEVLLIPNRI